MTCLCSTRLCHLPPMACSLDILGFNRVPLCLLCTSVHLASRRAPCCTFADCITLKVPLHVGSSVSSTSSGASPSSDWSCFSHCESIRICQNMMHDWMFSTLKTFLFVKSWACHQILSRIRALCRYIRVLFVFRPIHSPGLISTSANSSTRSSSSSATTSRLPLQASCNTNDNSRVF